ncbi:MAG: hypothetical protein IJ326_06615 [Lachnospiraceae bacterium]|nr:hypothetical protein [Lachnospiraceae bacterium]
MTRSLSKSGVLKSSWFYVNPSETRVIDTNALVEEKLKELSDKLREETGSNDDFVDEFSQGIEAEQVMDLVGEEAAMDALPEPEPEPAEPIPSKEEIIQEAMVEINAMKQQVMTELDAIKEKAIEEGKQIGYEDGLEQGRQEGLESVASQRKQLEQKHEALRAQLEEEYQKKMAELEPMFIETLTGIYEHIFKVSLKNSRELIVHLIANTLKNAEGNSGYLIHVSKEDYPFVSMQKKELVKGTGISVDVIDIIEDVTLSRGECMIETGNGVFDCSLGTQLEALNEELRLLAYEPHSEEEA